MQELTRNHYRKRSEAESEAANLTREVALVRIAQIMQELRRVRREIFGLNADGPAFDMLLELYHRENSAECTTATLLQEATHVFPSVACRWLRHLEHEGFVRCRPHPIDSSIDFVELTEMTKERLEGYLGTVLQVAAQQSET